MVRAACRHRARAGALSRRRTAINDLIAGHVKLGALGSTPLIPHYRAGKLLLLAQTTEARALSLPDIPTFQEAGIKGLVIDQWLGLFMPAGTPAAIVARLNAETGKALNDAAIRKSFGFGAGAGRRQRDASRSWYGRISEVRAAGAGAQDQGAAVRIQEPSQHQLIDRMVQERTLLRGPQP